MDVMTDENKDLDLKLLLAALMALKKGDFSARMPTDWGGQAGKIADTLNDIIENNAHIAREITQVSRVVGKEGRLAQRASVPTVMGGWASIVKSVNTLIDDLVRPTIEMARVISAVAKGDLSQTMALDADGRPLKGQFLRAASTANTMVDQLSSFASEVTRVAREVGVEGKLGGQASVPGAAGTWKDLTENVNQLAANLSTQVRAIAEVATAVTRGDLSRSIQVEARGEVSELKDNINEMIRNLKETTQKNAQQDWLKTNLARFTRLLQGQRDLRAVTALILSELAPLVSAQHGVFYMMDAGEQDEPHLRMIANYGYRPSRKLPRSFLPGEGLIGQCALEKQRIWLTDVPRDYIMISSGLGAAAPTNIVVLPILFEQQVKAVIEIASLDRFTETHLWFMDQLMESIGVVLNTIEANSRTERLLTQSQSLAQELQQTNLELAEKARLLSAQNIEVERKNREVEQAKRALEEKATQLALSSKYKSEFLANMSHELRTPLNSLLILAQQLSDNPSGNLSDTQVEFAKTIHGSGSDLLTLINDILDLSKIESGTVTLELSEYRFQTMRSYVERTFRHMAEAKNLGFSVELAENLPPSMMTDTTRFQQILKNLLSNAFKFTNRGRVSLSICVMDPGWKSEHPVFSEAQAVLAFSVIDTGVGIASDKLQLIFEAFQQADGSTARKYGGTGLGLSISRELARLLGGEIRVVSEVGRGSTFTLYLPYNGAYAQRDVSPSQFNQPALFSSASNVVNFVRESGVEYLPATAMEKSRTNSEEERMTVTDDANLDDRALIAPGDLSVLIVEDDTDFAKTLIACARANEFKTIFTAHGDAALTLARDYLPTAVLLSIHLSDIDGLTVLDRLKHDPRTRHIPVHMLAALHSMDVLSNLQERERSLGQGAASYLTKPLGPERLREEFLHIQRSLSGKKRSLLVVQNDKEQRDAIVQLIEADDVDIVAATPGEDALNALRSTTPRFDCMVLEPDSHSVEFIEAMSHDERLRCVPVVLYPAKDWDEQAKDRLKRMGQMVVIKNTNSLECLLDETALFLHRSPASLREQQRRMLDGIHSGDGGLANRKVLIVDDDLRNIFALSSVLERQKMKVLFAENGKDGIEVLERDPSIEIVLMDIMMPEMDGYDTMRAIRRIPRFKSLPIITLTAKAMKGDRDKCLAAGASDYITKPVDVSQLLSMMRVWLRQ